eukprot:CAMPEP_0198500068 /NCGR_PEP_ID=MMETSP1462-20131121/7979_1 /TAXON_ID=1333877 /ORGANISM="Brandtodinium nutriculum, Strain RCC3387" /LENGTH=122 /DNA_ID=CAMNT_0044229075 /DNA_START=36 /DNA_END=401 /DNA_ORIENTATION=+
MRTLSAALRPVLKKTLAGKQSGGVHGNASVALSKVEPELAEHRGRQAHRRAQRRADREGRAGALGAGPGRCRGRRRPAATPAAARRLRRRRRRRRAPAPRRRGRPWQGQQAGHRVEDEGAEQ